MATESESSLAFLLMLLKHVYEFGGPADILGKGSERLLHDGDLPRVYDLLPVEPHGSLLLTLHPQRRQVF